MGKVVGRRVIVSYHDLSDSSRSFQYEIHNLLKGLQSLEKYKVVKNEIVHLDKKKYQLIILNYYFANNMEPYF